MKKIWLGSDRCDCCHKKIESILYDSQTIYGCWAVLCDDCFKEIGMKVGQSYIKNSKGLFEKKSNLHYIGNKKGN